MRYEGSTSSSVLSAQPHTLPPSQRLSSILSGLSIQTHTYAYDEPALRDPHAVRPLSRRSARILPRIYHRQETHAPA